MFNIVYYGLLFIYEEILYKLVLQLPLNVSVIFFSLTIGLFVGYLSQFIPKRINYFIFNIINLLLCIYYGTALIVKKVFGIIITPSTFTMYKQVTSGAFKTLFFDVITSNILIIILILLPFIVGLFLNRYLSNKPKFTYILVVVTPFILFLLCSDSLDTFYSNKSDVNKLGVCSSIFMNGDVGLEPGLEPGFESVGEKDDEVTYTPQISNIDFDSIESDNQAINDLNNYFKNQVPTYTNEYTGMFEGKNLIYIMAESFDGYFVDKELTPTLYKMIHDGLYFKNYYTPTNLSTIGGEFSLLTGLLPDLAVLNNQWNSNYNNNGHHNYYPYGLGNLFKNLGYEVYAYHDYFYNFQNRDYYLKDLGFDNYKACGNGMETRMDCSIFPASDDEMINGSIDDYINSDKFMVYYVTVSGHAKWGFGYNAMAEKNKSLVNDLDYSETVRAYISANLELEKAMTTLLDKLSAAGKLEDTVIVMASDHHPYFMEYEQMEELAGKELDKYSLYKNDLIIYNPSVEDVTVDKICNTIDVLPTILNLFGIEYDSRIIVGKDILSDSDGIAVFADYSWLADNDSDYSNVVSNKYLVSKNIMVYDYYRYLFDGATRQSKSEPFLLLIASCNSAKVMVFVPSL